MPSAVAVAVDTVVVEAVRSVAVCTVAVALPELLPAPALLLLPQEFLQ